MNMVVPGGSPSHSWTWHPKPQLRLAAGLVLLPTLAIWVAFAAAGLGIDGPRALVEAALPAANAPILQRVLVGWPLTLVLPALAALLVLLGSLGLDSRIGGGEFRAVVRLAPSSVAARLLVLAVLLASLLLFALMSGHLVADCVFGADCRFTG